MPAPRRSEKAHDVLAAEEFELPAPDPRLHSEAPHDILAAEEFELPYVDPSLHSDPPHDILAAEEFELPAPDPNLHHGPFTPPGDPSGIAEPHDVLAADEFAVPAGPPTPSSRSSSVADEPRRTLLILGALALVALLRRRRHRS
ncbi:MAG TPA: hypothetical protein VFN55_16495 [Solirubrobacteraceae bacterium]|nr:hypothetical protein [Solirubrobacteraceae bacterium]